jgi:hypothetical protein
MNLTLNGRNALNEKVTSLAKEFLNEVNRDANYYLDIPDEDEDEDIDLNWAYKMLGKSVKILLSNKVTELEAQRKHLANQIRDLDNEIKRLK